ncbi:surfeit locus protein 6 homolog isoform X1 [Selaginella moellendorffii]|uniref:surfeit locus protein 6 homolog isoform X1 n=1 Tax=Selaginella moellendorffii TaxID=88036 RepID=UPI000D1CB2CD|nr:surfeit locus protein 6 homolog isoform X1 [Selaginella moellendorffii]|eukprot:XP_024536649.1 surfeit locus protein 6 homolog isoform X1 [Selaginella moellendorffii]
MGCLAIDLAEIVCANSRYFDELVDLIPPKFYLPADDNVEKQWVFGMTKREKREARRLTKEHSKKARRDRLDPEKFVTTLQVLQQRNEVAEAHAEKEEEDEEAKAEENGKGDAEQAPVAGTERVKSSQELRERLHKRIEAIRAERRINKARDWQERTKDASKKRKKSENKTTQANKRQKQGHKETGIVPVSSEKVPVASDMEFGRVKIDSQKRTLNRKSKEKLLEQATKLQKDIQDTEKGKDVASKHSWDAALSRASGQKVFDNPKLLKQSLKREHQRREKSAKKWQDRHDSEAQRAQEKQQTRASHIKERIDARKQRLIAKVCKLVTLIDLTLLFTPQREKKLMRPGFEGRKAGFLNEAK